MKKLALMAIIGISVLSGCASVQTEAEWKLKKDYTVAFHSTACGYETASYCISGGLLGETHYSLDGGLSWQKGSKTAVSCRMGLDILDAKTAFTSGEAGIARTDDGGITWTGINHIQFDEVSFLDADNGWAGRDTLLQVTADGGLHWNTVIMPDGFGPVASLSASSPDVVSVIDDGGRFIRSDDRGKSWQTPGKAIEIVGYACIFHISALRTSSGESVLMAVYARRGNKTGWLLLESRNKGKTWSHEEIDGTFGNSFLGHPYLSHDGTLFTVSDSGLNRITLYSRE